MEQIYHSLSVFLLLLVVSAGSAVAQKDSTKLNQSVEVMKAYQPSISNANKVNLMPVIEDTTRHTPEFIYSIESKPVNTGFSASPVSAADVNRLSASDLGLGYLKLGAGTFSTLNGDFFLNVPKSEIGTFGLHLSHLSSDGQIKLREGDFVKAPFSQNKAAIFGAVNIGSTILSTDISYNRDVMLYYGYPVSIPDKIDTIPYIHYGLKQAYQKGDLKIALQSNDKSQGDFKFNTGIRLGFFDAKTGQKETSGGFFGKFDYNFGEYNGILDLSYDHLSTDSIFLGSPAIIGNKSEEWVKVAPSVRIGGDTWLLRGGINFVNVSGNNNGSVSKLYPDFEFNFRPVKEVLTLYASFKGDLKNNRYGDIAYENYWSDPHHNVRNTDFTYVVSGGLKGKISREFSYNLGLKYSQVKDQYFYVQHSYNNLTSSAALIPLIYNNAFDVSYDNAGIFNLSTEFSYISGKDLSVIIKADYYNYKLESLPFAPQKPNFDLSASVGLRIIDKLTGFADAEISGKRQALVYNTNQSAGLSIFDIEPSILLNLGASYELTSNFKLFGLVNNLLNRQNEQWLGYASQGLRLMAGVTISF